MADNDSPARASAVALRFAGKKLVGVLNRPAGPDSARFPAVLFLHGFPGSEKNVDVQRRLLDLGVASFSLHFAGAWGSEGNYTFTSLVPQAAAGLRYLSSRPFVDARRVAVFGFSMGGWTAINLAARAKSVRAVCAVAPAGGSEMVGPRTRGFVSRAIKTLRVSGVDALTRDFAKAVRANDPAKAAARLDRPLLIVHGDADDVIPFGVARRIKAAAPGATLMPAPGARHDFLDRRPWLAELTADWLAERLR